MMHTTCNPEPVERLADEFVARTRRGETPSISAYLAEYPEYAEQIEHLFPIVALMEQLRIKAEVESARRGAASWETPERIGDFDIIREIGRGGMGVVYEAEQRSLARRVAVKVLPLPGEVSKQRLIRFRSEAQTAGKLRHTAIVPVFGAGEQDGVHYYVMPLVRGVGLDEIIARWRAADRQHNGRRLAGASAGSQQQEFYDLVRTLIAAKFPAPDTAAPGTPLRDARPAKGDRWTAVARVGLQAAEALHYAHAQGTLHRDIKPANLLLDQEGNACLLDFGLARAIEPDPSDRAGDEEVVGTLGYMAPEQRCGAADVRTDVFGLGLTLYELLTLRRAGCTPTGGSQRTVRPPSLPVTRPRQIDRTIPRDLEAVVMKCVAREPAHRYPSATALAADLRCFLENRPIRARRVSWLEKACRWRHRNPALAGVSATAVLLLVAFLAAAFAGHLRTRRAYDRARVALDRSEETLAVALDALEDVYTQLAPDRVWSSEDADPAGPACTCFGLRSGRPAGSEPREEVRVPPSEQTAALLQNLLVFYDRLSEQFTGDGRIMLEAAIATRRVGDIRQRLGQIDQAEREYHRATAKLEMCQQMTAPDLQTVIEWARCHNEIGTVRTAQFDTQAACEAHHAALHALRAADPDKRAATAYRYELARTYFFLANRQSNQPASCRESSEAYRQQAITVLEDLVRAHPEAADYRFLLALCYRPLKIGPAAAVTPADTLDRQRSLEILKSLKRQYPQVVEYRYELAATYAWEYVGLFPWQGRSGAPLRTEHALHQALDEIQWLVENNPSIHDLARGKALILAKLAAICTETRRVEEASDWFQRAFDTQSALVNQFPELSVHDRVLQEFYRFRLAQSWLQKTRPMEDEAMDSAVGMLATCVENLTEIASQRDLAEDRLALGTLRLAQEELLRIRGLDLND